MKMCATTSQIILAFLSLFLSISTVSSSSCPGSPSWKHAKCEMKVQFDQSCTAVQSEINLRLTSSAWVDPHNAGTYTQTSAAQNDTIQGSRITGDGKYTDLFNFSFSDVADSKCEVVACSESQVFSVLDYSTNYCNLRNLFCNSSDGCVPVQHDLDYTEDYSFCGQNKKENCIVGVSSN